MDAPFRHEWCIFADFIEVVMQQLQVSVFDGVRIPGSSSGGSRSHYGVRNTGSMLSVAS